MSTTFTQITDENYRELKDKVGGWGTWEQSVRVTANNHWTEISVYFEEDIAEAEAFAALFPKYVKARQSSLSTSEGDYFAHDGSHRSYKIYAVSFRVTTAADGVNGGVNETGLKRLKKFVEIFHANDPSFTGWVMNGSTKNPLDNSAIV